MRDYGKIISKLSSTPWLMTEDGLDTLLHIIEARINSGEVTDAQLASAMRGREEREYHSYGAQVTNGVGILPLEGPIFGKANLMTSLSGATSLQMFRQDFRSMLADDSIHSIVMEMDTPGGSSDFVQETAAEIFASREVKPTYAIANNMCGSAGLFLASQATKCYSTPSGEIGSLGVFRVHVDQSQKDAKDGYKFSYIKAGQFKTEGNPHEPLTHEAANHHQAGVNELYNEFVSAVAQGRGVSTEHVLQNFGQGRMLSARQAAEVGLIDDVVEMDSLVSSLQTRPVQVAINMPDGTSPVGVLTTGTNTNEFNWTPLGFQLEHAQEEHSEPGSGTPPIPRTDEDDRSGDRNNAGQRRDTPPIQNPNSDTVTGNSAHATPPKHGEEDTTMNNEILSALGLSADADDGQVLTAITNLTAKLSAREAAEIKAQTFAEMFPVEAAELAANRESRIDNEASTFARENSWVMTGVGDGASKTSFALSALATEQVENCYKMIATGDADSLTAFSSLIALLNTDVARVKMTETGSSLPADPDGGDDDDDTSDDDDGDVEEGTNVRTAAKRLAARARAIQAKNGDSMGDSLAAAAKQMPNAARIYQDSLNNSNNRGQ